MKQIINLLTLLLVTTSFCYAQNEIKPKEDEKLTYPLLRKADVIVRTGAETKAFPLLKGRIVVNKANYGLDLWGLSEKDFIKKTKEKNYYIHTPKIDMYIEITNVSKETIVFEENGDIVRLEIELTGPGAFSVVKQTRFANIYTFNVKTSLKPGQSRRWKLTMRSGRRGSIYNYWTQPGEYFLQFTQKAGLVKYPDSNQQGSLEIVSPKIRIEVSKENLEDEGFQTATGDKLPDSLFEYDDRIIGVGGGAAGKYGERFGGKKEEKKCECEKCKDNKCSNKCKCTKDKDGDNKK